MRVVEAISMFQEVDLLEAHLSESRWWADKIYIIESPITFSGQVKEMYFERNKRRYAQYAKYVEIEHLITPPEVFTPIPASYPEDESGHWYRERRKNRNKNRQWHWDTIRKDADYAYMNDVDEFVSARHWHKVQEILDEGVLYGAIKARKFNYWINAKGSSQEQWRITRCDLDSFEMRKHTFRKGTEDEVGWHFTNCFAYAQDQYLKNLGICNHMGVAAADIPSKQEIQNRLNRLEDPFIGCPIGKGIQELMPYDDVSWLPIWMRINLHLFPWLHKEKVPAEIVERCSKNVEEAGSWRLPTVSDDS